MNAPARAQAQPFSKSPAENYERYFVPAIGGPMAEDLIEAAALRPGERVLAGAAGDVEHAFARPDASVSNDALAERPQLPPCDLRIVTGCPARAGPPLPLRQQRLVRKLRDDRGAPREAERRCGRSCIRHADTVAAPAPDRTGQNP